MEICAWRVPIPGLYQIGISHQAGKAHTYVMALTLIPGTPPPDTHKQRVIDRIKAMPKPACMLQCRRCGGCETMVLTSCAMLKNGKVGGGTKQIVCASCFMRGERVVLV